MILFTKKWNILVFTVVVSQWFCVAGETLCFHQGLQKTKAEYCVYAMYESGDELRVCQRCVKALMYGVPKNVEMNKCIKAPGYKAFKLCNTELCNGDPCLLEEVGLENTTATTLHVDTSTRFTPAWNESKFESTPETSETTKSNTFLPSENVDESHRTRNTETNGTSGHRQRNNQNERSRQLSSSTSTSKQTKTNSTSSILNPGGSFEVVNTETDEISEVQHHNQYRSSEMIPPITNFGNNTIIPPNVVHYVSKIESKCECNCVRKDIRKTTYYVTKGASSVSAVMFTILPLLYLF